MCCRFLVSTPERMGSGTVYVTSSSKAILSSFLVVGTLLCLFYRVGLTFHSNCSNFCKRKSMKSCSPISIDIFNVHATLVISRNRTLERIFNVDISISEISTHGHCPSLSMIIKLREKFIEFYDGIISES